MNLPNHAPTQQPKTRPSLREWKARLGDRPGIKALKRWRLWFGNRSSLKAKKWSPILAHAATLIISAAALYVISKQAWIYEQQRKVMTDQTKIMNEQTEMIRIAERAYVGVATITAHLQERQVVLALENVGHIPANKLSVTIWEATTKSGAGSVTYHNEDQLFPGSLRWQITVSLGDLQPEEVGEIIAKKQRLYVLGVIEYDDGFGGKQKNYFGYEYQPPPNEFWIVRSDTKLPQ